MYTRRYPSAKRISSVFALYEIQRVTSFSYPVVNDSLELNFLIHHLVKQPLEHVESSQCVNMWTYATCER
jgi:hypothetical protein